MSRLSPSASPRPLEMSGMASVTPPPPVPVATPAPVRLNHTSTVTLETLNPSAVPKVM